WSPLLSQLWSNVEELTDQVTRQQEKFRQEIDSHHQAVTGLEKERAVWKEQDAVMLKEWETQTEGEKNNLKKEIDTLTENLQKAEQDNARRLTAKDEELRRLTEILGEQERAEQDRQKDEEGTAQAEAARLKAEIETMEQKMRRADSEHSEKTKDLDRRRAQ